MNNWFYMNRMTFKDLLNDELGSNLTQKLLSFDFDTPVSFMIGETFDEILTKIQQTFSREICRKIICDDHCLSCSINPPSYAKLAWFIQRLCIMSPLNKPFIKQISSSKLLNKNLIINISNSCNSNEQNQKDLLNICQNKNEITKIIQNTCSDSESLKIIILILIISIIINVLRCISID